MSRARMLNDTLIQHIHSSFAEGSGSGHGHHSVIAGQQPHGEMIDTDTCRAGAVKDYIKMMLEAEQLKFLVFAHHLTMLQACTEAVIEAKAGYIRIDGSVPSSERIQLVHKFQNDPETRVAILSILAAGQ
ncbi:DNA annealing helicase and endonuclease ZRANB3 isoform X1, partial [Lates japonicus]